MKIISQFQEHFKITKILLSLMLFLNYSLNSLPSYAKTVKTKEYNRDIYLSDLNNINLTNETSKNLKEFRKIIKSKVPKSIFIEEWLLSESHNKKLLKKLRKITKKYNVKFYIVIGKNTWFGKRGLSKTLIAYDLYGKYTDGIVLRLEPNKTNVWQKYGDTYKARILNQMLDAYSAIYIKSKELNKDFIVEFPFWFSDFIGPLKSFPQDVCTYADKIIFLIDDEEKLEDLKIKWNDVTCRYYINLTKRANDKSEEKIKDLYHKINSNISFFSNFHGYIIDSDSILDNPETPVKKDISD